MPLIKKKKEENLHTIENILLEMFFVAVLKSKYIVDFWVMPNFLKKYLSLGYFWNAVIKWLRKYNR